MSMHARHRVIDSPLGPITLVVDADGLLTGCYLQGQAHLPPPVTLGDREPTVAAEAVRQLAEYFAGERRQFDLLLSPRGTDFQRRVWQALAEIPYGRTATYGELARSLGVGSARAVGSATGRNPISIIVPCHRLVGAGGALTGYAGGLERKRWLLDLEAAPAANGA